jgi:hypothetical protein
MAMPQGKSLFTEAAMRAAMMLARMGLTLVCGCGIVPTLDELILDPGEKIRATPADFGYAYDEITVPVAPGRSVVIWHVQAVDPKGLVVVIPGSSGNKGRYAQALPIFLDANYDAILMDYEGFGQSPGEVSLQNAADDALAVTQYALSLHEKVVLFGPSLGAPLAVRAAAEYDVAGLILEAPLILKREVALYLSQFGVIWPEFVLIANVLVNPQVPDAFDIQKYIRQVEEPKLIMHSPQDEVVPFLAGQEVFEDAPPPKEFWQMRHPHGEMIERETEVYAAKVRGWLDATLGHSASGSQTVTMEAGFNP